jgi:two-component system response regulator DesR
MKDQLLRVLIADDHAPMRCAVVQLLCGAFHIVGAVCDGEELVLSATCLQPNVIVSDILMPRLDGIAARNKLFGQQNEIPFVFLSALGKEIVHLVSDETRPVAFVYKGEIVDHLNSAITAVLAGQRYFSPHYL